MAEQAIQFGRTVALEPMPPYERRIVHLALRDNPDVTTESTGEGEHRKVTIIPSASKSFSGLASCDAAARTQSRHFRYR